MPLVEIRTLPTPLSSASVPLPPVPKGDGIGHTRLWLSSWGSPNSYDWYYAYNQSVLLFTRYTHQTSGFKTSGFKTSGFKTSGFKTSGLQNVRFTKCQVSKRLVSKRLVFKFDILIKQKVFVFVIFTYELLAIIVIYDKKTLKNRK